MPRNPLLLLTLVFALDAGIGAQGQGVIPPMPAAAGQHAADYLNAFLDHAASGKSAATGGSVPLDFISFHV
jgi:hypothetical protein